MYNTTKISYNGSSFTGTKDSGINLSDNTPLVLLLIQLSVFTTVIITASTGNMLVCIAVWNFRQLKTATNYALVSLAVTDVLMVYVMVLHAVMVSQGEWSLGITLCDVTSTIGLTLNLMSLLHLTYISLERFIAITKPFRYQVWITKKRVVGIMISLWVCASMLLNQPWADFKYRSNVFGCLKDVKRGEFRPATLIILLTFVSCPSAFILFTQLWICRIAHGHAKKLTKQHRNLRISYNEPTPSVIFNQESTDENSLNRTSAEVSFRREMKSVKTFGIVVGCFSICYIPFYTVATMRSFQGLDSVPTSVLTTVTWIGFANSAMNPIFYSLRHRQFKAAFKKMFRKGMGKIFPLLVESSRRSSSLDNSSSFHNELSRKSNQTPVMIS